MNRAVRSLIVLLLILRCFALASCGAIKNPAETTKGAPLADSGGRDGIGTQGADITEATETSPDYGFGFFSSGYFSDVKVLIIDTPERLAELHDFMGNSHYTTRNSAAYDDCERGIYDEKFFSDGGRLAALFFCSSSGTNRYYTYSDTAESGVTIHLCRRNPYITIRSADIGRFINLEPIERGYTAEQIAVVQDNNRGVYRDESGKIEFVGISSGKERRADTWKTYYAEAYSSLLWASLYDDTQGAWLNADGYGCEEAIKQNRDKITAVKVSEGMELVFASGSTASCAGLTVVDIDLGAKRKISSLSELTSLEPGIYYLVCEINVVGRTIGDQTEGYTYYCILLVDAQ